MISISNIFLFVSEQFFTLWLPTYIDVKKKIALLGFNKICLSHWICALGILKSDFVFFENKRDVDLK